VKQNNPPFGADQHLTFNMHCYTYIGDMQIALRWTDPNNHIRVQCNTGANNFRLIQMLAGVVTVLDIIGLPMAPGDNFPCTLDIVGNTVNWTVDAVIGVPTITGVLAAGQGAIMANGGASSNTTGIHLENVHAT